MANIYEFALQVAVIVASVFKLGDALVCLNCENVADPRICRHVTTCFAGEKCGMETFISHDGSLQYKLGCVNENTCGLASTPTPTGSGQTLFYSCHDCCDGSDLCNIRGCNITGYPSVRGPVCYNCEDHPTGYPCHTIEACETHEVCYNEARIDFETKTVYNSGCRSKHNCGAAQLDPVSVLAVGRRSEHVCSDCCADDLCNVDCQTAANCKDESTCPLLMASYDICQNVDVAKKVCPRSCNLCPAVGGATVAATSAATVGQTTAAHTTHKATTHTTTHRPTTHRTHRPTTKSPTTPTTTSTSTTTTTPMPTTTSTTTTTTTPVPTTTSTTTTTTTTPKPTTTTTTTTPVPTTTSTTTTTTASQIPVVHIGDLVVRGPDWIWGNQDNGTVGQVQTVGKPAPGYVQVYWPATNFTNVYSVGFGGKYEVVVFNGTTVAPSTTASQIAVLHIGDLVVRGPDWKWGNQDNGTVGQVQTVGKPAPGYVQVYWSATNVTNVYSVGFGGKYEVVHFNGTTVAPSTTASISPVHIGASVVRGPDWIWGNQDNGTVGQIQTVGKPVPGYVQVYWPATNVTNVYRLSYGGKYDVILFNGTTVAPATTAAIPAVHIGALVVRGPDWIWANQDNGSIGEIVDFGKPVPGYVQVHWPVTNVTNVYRLNFGGKFDVILFNGTTAAPATTAPTPAVHIGALVVRGPNWIWANQDNHTIGEIVDFGKPVPGYVQVHWPATNVTNVYRLNFGGKFDVILFNGTTTASTTRATTVVYPSYGPSLASMVKVGSRVARGVDWKWDNQDSNGMGTVVGIMSGSKHGWVQVRWDNGTTNEYRLGAEGAYDLKLVSASGPAWATTPPPVWRAFFVSIRESGIGPLASGVFGTFREHSAR